MTPTSIARPYANAIFQIAMSDGQVDRWMILLDVTTTLCKNKDLISFMSSPTPTFENKISLITNLVMELLPSSPTTKEMNFIKLLIKNQRLILSSEIYIEFQNYLNDKNKTKCFDVFSAHALTKPEKKKITNILSQGEDYTVNINVSIDKSLLAGIVVRDGDAVIDVSIREMTHKLASHLSIN